VAAERKDGRLENIGLGGSNLPHHSGHFRGMGPEDLQQTPPLFMGVNSSQSELVLWGLQPIENYLVKSRQEIERGNHELRFLGEGPPLPDSLSRIFISGKMGSMAVLPCDWSKIPSTRLPSSSPHVEWLNADETVFKRLGAEMFQGQGYKDHADVPEDKLLEGDCSLVLKNVTHDDAGLYESFMTIYSYSHTVLNTSGYIAVRVNSAGFIMRTYYWTFLLSLATCAGSLSAQSIDKMFVKVGSTAVLSCDWSKIPSTQLASSSPHVEWRTVDETVFERLGAEMFQGEGYKDRADVPEDKLLEGDCSLVLKNVTHDDEGLYQSFLTVSRTKRSLGSKRVLLQRVELSVQGKEIKLQYMRPKFYTEYAPQKDLSGNKAPERGESNTENHLAYLGNLGTRFRE
ncbi:hypothetical protein NFI96_026830, partial [Prochilodus magdalenae]